MSGIGAEKGWDQNTDSNMFDPHCGAFFNLPKTPTNGLASVSIRIRLSMQFRLNK
ncbi:hypothetical protein DPMN_138351 [Dreissena polymorpha]|uniref:Uncharacterized protein n=1 Tax=Dreissena polymorpha TaxID=45954 RepID=A0A9D4G6H3_DREPO|nr:hypothetical protein DPMN_138351 [Dreissena polymorpha]